MYIITSNFINNSILKNNPYLIKSSAYNGTICFYFNSCPTKLVSQISTVDTSKIIQNFYKLISKTVNTESARYTANLIDPDNWKEFVDSALAEEAIGSPTIEMLVEYWNNNNNTKSDKLSLSASGNSYDLNGSVSHYSTTINNDPLLISPIQSTNYQVQLFIAGPTTNGTATWRLQKSSNSTIQIGTNANYLSNSNNFGARPVVRLRSESCLLIKNGLWTHTN